MDPALQIAIIVICIIFSAYFSATETAFSTFNKIRIKNLAEKGNKKASLVM
jgi:Mg2+/Co2+ transporter CorB